MFKGISKCALSISLCSALLLGALGGAGYPAAAEGTTSAVTGGAVSGPSIGDSDTVINPDQVVLDRSSIIVMAGKKITLTLSGAELFEVGWSSQNENIATVTPNAKNVMKGVVKGEGKGSTVITAAGGGVVRECKVTVVAKMQKKDFGKFDNENFISYCKRKGYDNGYAWTGQWKGGSRKKSTYRGIKVENKLSKVEKAYGELDVKNCKASDPFTKMKGLKKNKVKTYADVKYGKYRIRFYFNAKKKVVAIILACNIGKIKKSALKEYM